MIKFQHISRILTTVPRKVVYEGRTTILLRDCKRWGSHLSKVYLLVLIERLSTVLLCLFFVSI